MPLWQILSKRQIPGLEGLRAVAAYLVVFYHFHLPWVPGGLGVLAFFVLSGFLITWLLLMEADRYGSVSLRLFYLRRSLRIFPAFYVYAAGVVALLWMFDKRVVPGQTIAALTYTNNYYQAIWGDPNTALSHTWSLAIEEQFYLLWPLAFLSLHRTPARMARWLAVAIAVVWVHRLVLIALGAPQGYLYEAFDTRADHLMIGCLLAVVLHQRWYERLWQAATSSAVIPVLTVGALVFSAYLQYAIQGYGTSIGFMVDPVLIAFILVQCIALSESSRLWRWANWRTVRYLGRISYSVYLYQQIAPSFVEAVAASQPFGVQLAAHVALVTILASLSYWIVEMPFLLVKDRIGRRQHGRVTPAATAAPISPSPVSVS
jgi:peptidoglycan/LPS O-acetylase OafA/YrhL